jgi:VWFA-related protein
MKFLSARAAWFRSCVVVAVAGAAVLIVRAQPAESGIPTPTFRSNSHLVLVDVVVTDKAGKAITGLKADDFVVEENGKKQKISVFVTPEEAFKTAAAPELPPGIYSNEPQYRAPGGPITVFVLDAANTPFRDQSYGRLQMMKYVKDQKKPDERMAIFTLTNGLHVVQDFTADPGTLTAALKRYKPQEPVLGAAGPVPPSDIVGGGDTGVHSAGLEFAATTAQNEIASFQNIQVGYQLDMRTITTLEAMRELARVLGGMPGRKEVIWLTAAFPFDLVPEDRSISEAEASLLQQGVRQTGLGTQAAGSMAEHSRNAHEEEIKSAAAQLSAAQVALYPIDVRGLASGMEVNFNNVGTRSAMDYSTNAQVAMSDIQSDHAVMRTLAEETGGKAYVNENEIREGIRIALDDNVASYTLGYYPENKKWDGKYRNIKVKVNHEGAQVRNRKGYFAYDPNQVKGHKANDVDLAEALKTSAPSTLVSFKAQVKPPDKGKIPLTFLVDGNSVTAADSGGGKKKVDFDLYATVFSPDGKMLASRSLKVQHEFTADEFGKAMQQGIGIPMEIDAPQGKDNQVRLAVRDNPTGNVGTIVAPAILP